MTNRTRGMILKMIEAIWGNLRTKPARIAWAKSQVARNETEDAIFRQWLLDNNVPDDIARRALETGSREKAIAFLAKEKDWIQYYKIQIEVRNAFKTHELK